MTEPSNIQSLHGRYFTAEICFKDVVGRISVTDSGGVYLCQDSIDGGGFFCRDFFGYKHSVYVADIENMGPVVQNLKILPSPLEYHRLLTEILPTLYGFDPTAIMIKNFISEIKVFDPKNLGK